MADTAANALRTLAMDTLRSLRGGATNPATAAEELANAYSANAGIAGTPGAELYAAARAASPSYSEALNAVSGTELRSGVQDQMLISQAGRRPIDPAAEFDAWTSLGKSMGVEQEAMGKSLRSISSHSEAARPMGAMADLNGRATTAIESSIVDDLAAQRKLAEQIASGEPMKDLGRFKTSEIVVPQAGAEATDAGYTLRPTIIDGKIHYVKVYPEGPKDLALSLSAKPWLMSRSPGVSIGDGSRQISIPHI
jgi:hypothetical protein